MISDDDIVLALRLGWMMAEVRGRYRIGDDPARLGTAGSVPIRRFENALPLMSERSPAEQRIEAEGVLASLARQAGVDVKCAELTGQPGTAAELLAGDRLTALAKALGKHHPDFHARWIDFTDFMYAWDASIQDALACRDFGTSSAYQLGRGLAEVFWAVEPSAPDGDARSPLVLLGDTRVSELDDLLQRLSGHLPPLAPAAISYSLRQWAAAARRGQLDGSQESSDALSRQVLVWRDMLLAGKDPKSYLRPASILDRAGQIREVARRFLPELALLACGVVVLSTGAALLTTVGTWHALGAALTVLGAAGISVSGVAAKMRDAASSLVTQLRNEFYEAAVSEATCFAPARIPDATPGPEGGTATGSATGTATSAGTAPGSSAGGRLGAPANIPGRAAVDQSRTRYDRDHGDEPATVTGDHPVVPPVTPPPPGASVPGAPVPGASVPGASVPGGSVPGSSAPGASASGAPTLAQPVPPPPPALSSGSE